MRVMNWIDDHLGLLAALVIVAFISFLFYALDTGAKKEKACIRQDGVLVTLKGGGKVCMKRGPIIDLPEFD
jgi:hypothetical protein